MSIRITSLLEKRHWADLEQLLFFHHHQGRFNRDIRASVARLGSPRIVERNGGLRIEIPEVADVQTLYAVARPGRGEELIGAMVYTRTSPNVLEILHIVVEPEYTLGGEHAQRGVTFELVNELCRIGRKIQGIEMVRLAYNRGMVVLQPIHQNQR